MHTYNAIEGENMNKYTLYGLVIETDIEISHLLKTDDNSNPVDVVIKQGNCKDEVTEYLKKVDAYEKRYEIGFDYSCFLNKGGYYVIKNGDTIIYETKDGFTPESLSPWLLGFAFSMVLLQRKTLAIHCSAVCEKGDGSENDILLISGRSGAGKSSLTKKLMEAGYKLMADDVAAVRCDEEVTVYPAFPYQKLCRNEVDKRELNYDDLIYINEDKDKFLVPVEDKFSSVPGKIRCMIYIVVADVPEVQVRKLSGLDQMMAIRRNLFLAILNGDWLNSPEVLSLCLKMAGSCPVYLVTRPSEGDTLEKISDIVCNIE